MMTCDIFQIIIMNAIIQINGWYWKYAAKTVTKDQNFLANFNCFAFIMANFEGILLMQQIIGIRFM